MQKKRNRFVIWIVGMVVAALVLTDMLPMFVVAQEPAPPAPIAAARDGEIVVAQQQQPRRRRTLMDLLFGNDEQQQQQEQPPVIEKPVRKPRPAAEPAPPPKPEVAKAAGATRLAVFGDLLAGDIGKALERFYAEDPNIVVITEAEGSSGLVRPDYFDWPGRVADEIAKNSFDIAVMIIGINDRQSMTLGEASYRSLTPEWSAEYSARVTRIVQQLRAANKPTIWIGLPPMEAPKFGQAMVQVNEIQRLAAFGGGAEFLDIYDRFASPEGTYTSRGPDVNGNQARMRKDDGIHFSTAGADKVAFYLSQSLRAYYRGGGTVGIGVADPLLGTDAQTMVRPPYQGLGQMKLLEVAGAVIPLSRTPKRATDMVSGGPEAAPAGFDLEQLVDAPAGRADAFGVGKTLGVVENPVGR